MMEEENAVDYLTKNIERSREILSKIVSLRIGMENAVETLVDVRDFMRLRDKCRVEGFIIYAAKNRDFSIRNRYWSQILFQPIKMVKIDGYSFEIDTSSCRQTVLHRSDDLSEDEIVNQIKGKIDINLRNNSVIVDGDDEEIGYEDIVVDYTYFNDDGIPTGYDGHNILYLYRASLKK